jgi:chromosomal replication initiation ATPase DnaA
MIYQPGLSVVNQLVERAARVTQFNRCEIVGPSRIRPLCHIRWAVMERASRKGLSLTAIGRHIGGRHHTTVLEGLRQAERLKTDPDFSELLTKLEDA